ncbi:hypothetical protein [Undibacterium sp.]|uniref:hypothetical protein n=1 Tax=Undibacterium sp. TaxID=1914977 RepID=UPI00375339A9
MEFGELRPILSGLIGGLIAMWLSILLARWLPEVCNGKSVKTLVLEYRYAIWFANFLLALGFVGTLALWMSETIGSDDWRAAGLGIGGGCVAILIGLALFGIVRRSPLKEVYVAYAVSQKTPVFLIYGILFSGVVSFFVTVSSFLI